MIHVYVLKGGETALGPELARRSLRYRADRLQLALKEGSCYFALFFHMCKKANLDLQQHLQKYSIDLTER